MCKNDTVWSCTFWSVALKDQRKYLIKLYQFIRDVNSKEVCYDASEWIRILLSLKLCSSIIYTVFYKKVTRGAMNRKVLEVREGLSPKARTKRAKCADRDKYNVFLVSWISEGQVAPDDWWPLLYGMVHSRFLLRLRNIVLNISPRQPKRRQKKLSFLGLGKFTNDTSRRQ